MNKFRVIVGDWSGDGHNETKMYVVVVDDKFTSEVLAANYHKNVKELGIDPTAFVDEYNENTLPTDIEEKLEALGVKYNVVEWGDDKLLTTQGMLEITMFLFGHGLEDFAWEQEPEITYPVLVGSYDSAIGPEAIGYGLFVS